MPAIDIAKSGLAYAHGSLQHSCEYWLKIAGRAADNLQHLRCCSLLLQRLGELPRALLLDFEQSGVLDGDHRLVSEGLDQLDLLLGEWTYGSAVQNEHANWKPITQERDA